MNKKAQTSIFEVTLVVFLLVVCGYALFSLVGLDKKVVSGIVASTKAADMYNEKARDEFYLEEACNLAAREAFYEIAAIGAAVKPECQYLDNGYAIWESGCTPSNSMFLKSFNKSLANYIERKFESRLENNNLIVNFEDSTMNVSESNFISYQINYNFNPFFVIDLRKEGIDLDFEKVYSSVMEKFGECRQMINIATCMKEFKADGWGTVVSSDSKYIFFDLSSEKMFFVNDKLQKITLKFALNL